MGFGRTSENLIAGGMLVDLGRWSKPACTLWVYSSVVFGRHSEKTVSWGDIWCELGLDSAVVSLLTVNSQAV